jgi:polyisoprenoid-binding protein YceI
MSTATDATAARTTWAIDPAHTLVELAVKHMMFTTVKGRFASVAGTLVLDDADPSASSVEATIDAASIDTREEGRDAHLRSADFLDVETYPTIEFRSTHVVPRGGGRYVVTGDLTLHGVTREVSLEAELTGMGTDPWGNRRVGFAATTAIDRKDFGLTWNAALEAGGVLVGDEVKISLEVQATRQDAT